MLCHIALNFYKKVPQKKHDLASEWSDILCYSRHVTIWLQLNPPQRKKHLVLRYCFMGGCVLITTTTINFIESWRIMGGCALIDLCVRIGESTHKSCIAQSPVHVEMGSDMMAHMRIARKYNHRACIRKKFSRNSPYQVFVLDSELCSQCFLYLTHIIILGNQASATSLCLKFQR
jgi:hypothetical protein